MSPCPTDPRTDVTFHQSQDLAAEGNHVWLCILHFALPLFVVCLQFKCACKDFIPSMMAHWFKLMFQGWGGGSSRRKVKSGFYLPSRKMRAFSCQSAAVKWQGHSIRLHPTDSVRMTRSSQRPAPTDNLMHATHMNDLLLFFSATNPNYGADWLKRN